MFFVEVLNSFCATSTLSLSLLPPSISCCLISLLSPVEYGGCHLRGGKRLIESIEAKRKLTTTGWLVLLFCLETNAAISSPEKRENASLGHFLNCFVFYVYAPHFCGSAFFPQCWSGRIYVFFLFHLNFIWFCLTILGVWIYFECITGRSGDWMRGFVSTLSHDNWLIFLLFSNIN